MQPSGSHVTDVQQPGVAQLALDIKRPFLNRRVIPIRLERPHEWKGGSRGRDERLLNELPGTQRQRSVQDSGQGPGQRAKVNRNERRILVSLKIDVAKSLIVKHAVATANNGLAVAPGLPRQADSRREIVPVRVLQGPVLRAVPKGNRSYGHKS